MEIDKYHGSKIESKDDIVETVIKEIYASYRYQYMLMAEVMSTRPGAFNPAIKGVKKRQLSYLAENHAKAIVGMELANISATQQFIDTRFKGGRFLRNFCSRGVARVQTGRKFPFLYMYHAPANSAKARKAMLMVTSFLYETHGTNPWILIGDFNIPPTILERNPEFAPFAQFIRSSGRKTHKGGNELDYVISSIPKLRVERFSDQGLSDHYPIIARW